jgi:hypothetical protein
LVEDREGVEDREWAEEAEWVCAAAEQQCDAGKCASNGAECTVAGDDDECCWAGRCW